MTYGNSKLQTIYNYGPTWLKNTFVSLYGWREQKRRYGNAFHQHLCFLRASQYWSAERLAAFQQERLWSFLSDVIPHTPYYREQPVYQEALSRRDFSLLPLLSKNIVRSRQADFHRKGWAQIPHKQFHTSGTTGQALVFPIEQDCFEREYAFRELHYNWGSVSLVGRMRFAFSAGHPVVAPDRVRPPFWAFDRVNRHLYFSSYHMSEKTLPAYIAALEKFSPEILAGYPSSIYLLSLATLRHATKKLQLRAVYTFSETLLDSQRQVIEDAFQCKVFNWYGNTEMCANIVECEKEELHLKAEHSFVEILNDDNQPCAPGQSGRLICTGFGNRLFPLIRYESHDLVTMAKKSASLCGRSGLLIERVEGRIEDYILTPEGRLVGRLDHLFKDSVRVIEAQIIQQEINTVVLRIVRASNFGQKDEWAIETEARKRLGPSIRIVFEYVDFISRTSSGKFRFVVSSLNQKNILKTVTGDG